MREDRLMILADFLDTLPNKRFEYRHWTGGDWGGKQDLSCGTTACAMGWACTIPSFRKEGLKLASGTARRLGIGPIFLGRNNFNAAAAFFEISVPDATFLFNHIDSGLSAHAPAAQVAHHIRKFIS